MPERTEAPTPRRLHEARERGQIVKSVELNAAAAMIAAAMLLQGPGVELVNSLKELIRQSIDRMAEQEMNQVWLKQIIYQDFSILILPLAQIMLGLMLVGTLINVVQTGMVWASRRQFFDFGRVNPVSGLKRMFSVRGLFELFKSLLKLLIIGWVAYSFLRDNTNQILVLAEMDFRSGLETYMQMVVDLIWRVAGIYLVLAVADYLYQRWEYMRNMRMSRQEILDEYKQTEGDPLLRGRIREQQRRIARMRMMSQVPKADVIITNPTHYAIAIKYDAKKMDAPVVLAKGAMLVAHRIVDIARSNHIPVVQNKPLARAIFKLVEVDNEIPPELYTAMAEVLAYVYRMKKKGLDPSTVPAEA